MGGLVHHRGSRFGNGPGKDEPGCEARRPRMHKQRWRDYWRFFTANAAAVRCPRWQPCAGLQQFATMRSSTTTPISRPLQRALAHWAMVSKAPGYGTRRRGRSEYECLNATLREGKRSPPEATSAVGDESKPIIMHGPGNARRIVHSMRRDSLRPPLEKMAFWAATRRPDDTATALQLAKETQTALLLDSVSALGTLAGRRFRTKQRAPGRKLKSLFAHALAG